jgi:cation diffusion facilitator family transporter
MSDGASPDPDHANRRTMRVTLVGMAVNFVLAMVKLVAGILGNSYALVADAVESFADIVGSAIIWGGLRVAARPPDDNHPYGHGKAEALASLAVAGLLLAAAVWIVVKSIHEIITPHSTPAWWTLVVLVVVVATKETMFRVARSVARREGSTAVHTDAWHHRADAITSLAAFVGISIALIGGEGWEPADDWAAILASVTIAWNAVTIARPPISELLDKRPGDIPERAAAVARTVDGVRDIEQAHARKAGTRYWVDMHVEVDPHLSVHEGHIISGKVKAAIRREIPEVAGVLVHIEPHQPATTPSPTTTPHASDTTSDGR